MTTVVIPTTRDSNHKSLITNRKLNQLRFVRPPQTAPVLLRPNRSAAPASRTFSNPAAVRNRVHLLVGKSQPDVAHLLLILLVLVRQHVDDSTRPPGRRTRATSASARAGSGE